MTFNYGTAGEEEREISATGFEVVTDPEFTGEDITWSSSTHEGVSAEIVEGRLKVSTTAQAEAGRYPLVITKDDGDYKITSNTITVVVGKANIPIDNINTTLKAKENAQKEIVLPKLPEGAVYGAVTNENAEFDVSEVSDGKLTLTSRGMDVDTAAMTFQVAVQGGKNYKNTTLTVTVQPIKPTEVTIRGIEAENAVYDGKSHAGYTGTVTLSDNHLTAEELTYTYTGTTSDGTEYDSAEAPKAAGEYRLTISTAEDNTAYIGSKVLDFVIEQAPVIITADNKTIKYGAEEPELTYTTEGIIVEGDTLTINITRDTGTEVGAYVIRVGQREGDNSNYKLTFKTGTLTIAGMTKAELEEIVKGLSASNTTTANDIADAVKEKVSELGYRGMEVEVSDFAKTEATKEAEGAVTGSITLKMGNKTETAQVNLPITRLPKTEEDKLAEGKKAIEEVIADFNTTNATTQEDVLKAGKDRVAQLGYTDMEVTLSNFKKTEATQEAAGSIIGTFTLKLGDKTATVEINLSIEKLPPVASPSVEPSKTPSVEPSKTPSVEPSKTPSVEPSKEPSVEPSKEPTEGPSKAPTEEPSITPTKKPVATPTKKPVATITKKPVATPTKKPDSNKTTVSKKTLEKNALSLNAKLKVSQTGSKINVSWGKVSEADGYNVYVQYCGKAFTAKSLNSVKSGKTTKITIAKVNGKKLDLKKNFKVYVEAYKKVNGKKVTLGKTVTAHIIGRKNTECTNVKAVKVKKSSYTLKVGKTATIKASTVLVDKHKKQLSDKHAKEFRYATSNKKVATVSGSGKIKAVGKGSCTVYVYARNGYAKKVKVTVK